MANELYFFRKIIYQLQKKYGFDIAAYRTIDTLNYQTGKNIVVRSKYSIKRAVILPSDVFRDYSYASVLSALNTNLQVGGLLDTTKRIMIINKESLPKHFILSTNDYIVFKHKRYNIVKITEMEVVDFIQLQVTQVEGEPVNEIHEHCLWQKVRFAETTING